MNDLDDLLSLTVSLVILAAIITSIAVLPILLLAVSPFAVAGGAWIIYLRSDGRKERKARERTLALYEEVKTANRPALDREEFIAACFSQLHLPRHHPHLGSPVAEVIGAIYDLDVPKQSIPSPPAICNSVEGARYRDMLSSVSSVSYPPLVEIVSTAMASFVDTLPDDLIEDVNQTSTLTVPLIAFLDDPGRTILLLIGSFYGDHTVGHFTRLKAQLDRNLEEVTGNKRESVLPPDYKGENIAYAYLKDTPLLRLLDLRIPFSIPRYVRYEHMHIVGGSGAGKTQLIQALIMDDLESGTGDPPSLVVVDSQSDLIRKLSHLKLAEDRPPIVISPRDLGFTPSINIFDLSHTYRRLASSDRHAREQVVAGVISTFDYLFTGLLGAELTAKQSVFFRFVARLLIHLPESMGRNATVLDMLRLMEDPAPYGEAIAALPDIQREFFERDFQSPTFRQTKEQVRYRLNAILENPTMAELFTTSESRFDMHAALESGAVIMIDTAKDYLKDASSHYGRLFISLVLQAVLERAAQPEQNRKPTFLYVDEAAEYFDSNIDDLLTETRKYRLGCTFAHQYLDQATPQLLASFGANTAIKFAGGVGAKDARALAPQLATTHAFIQHQPKGHFACHVRHHTPHVVSVRVPFGRMEEAEQVSDAEFEEAMRDAAERFGAASSPETNDPQSEPEHGRPATDPHAPVENW